MPCSHKIPHAARADCFGPTQQQVNFFRLLCSFRLDLVVALIETLGRKAHARSHPGALKANKDAPKSLLREADFLKLFGGSTTSGLGSQVSVLALPLTAIALLHAPALSVGTLAALGTLPYLLFSLPVGTWLERVRKRPVLVASALGRCVVLAIIPLLWALHHLDMMALYVVAFLVGTMSTLFDIAWQSYLPSLVGTSRLHEASARLSISNSGTQLAGPGLAGLLIRALSAPVALLADAAGFVAAGLFVGRIKRPEPQPPKLKKRGWLADIAEGVNYTARHQLLRWIAVGVASWNAVSSALNVALVLFESRVLHFSAGTIGLIFLLGNIGFVVGAPAVRRVTQRLGLGRTMVLAAVLGGSSPALFPLAHGAAAIPLLVSGWFVRALANPLYMANQVSLRLAITPRRLTARMTATMKCVVMGAMPLGSFLAGAAMGAFGANTSLWLIAIVSLASVGATALTKLRTASLASERRADDDAPTLEMTRVAAL